MDSPSTRSGRCGSRLPRSSTHEERGPCSLRGSLWPLSCLGSGVVEPAPDTNLMAEKLLVDGGHRLTGSVPISGAKNSALKLMAASLLASGRTTIRNVPRIVDCLTMGEVLQHLGADVRWDGSTVSIDTSTVDSVETPYELVSRMRA